ncbi:hypothetical protein PHMEG_00036117 [Phytophthora megakarya]|uniref:Reverse transcriptase n=1 Tax=Phytophthora megakarya TaxID=4795 RepID=A0A225UMQ0_9STRA|nr:hypothetical protein PHMEG_00036117 [Phytophthora megakarya]
MLQRLLRNFPNLLEPRDGCPPITTMGVEHGMHTGAEEHIKVQPRRHPHHEHKIIDTKIDKMTGASGFSVVLGREKGGTVRFCVAYRLRNVLRNEMRLPGIDDTFAHLHVAQRFTSLDLHSGYWQVPVA